MSDNYQSLLTTLCRLLTSRFDQEELRTLCFDLGIAYDDLRGEGRANKARELVLLMARRQRLPELIELTRHYRPEEDWPSLPEGFALDAIADHLETDPVPISTRTGPTFHIDSVEASIANLGGVQEFTAPVEVDMRETTINQPQGDVIMGDRIDMSGDFRGAIVNIKSRLDNVTQTIRALPHGNDAQKRELIRLIDELITHLEQVPPSRAKDADDVTKRVEALAREIDTEKPDKEMVEITGESLKRAAQNLKDVLPTVLTIASQIIGHAMHVVS